VLRRNAVPLFILVAVLIGLAAAIVYFHTTQDLHFNQTAQVREQRSEIRLDMTVAYDSGPLVREAYTMSDLGGTSTLQYRVVGRKRLLQITIRERPQETLQEGVNVAFLFDELVRDGIWQLTSRPLRGNTAIHYTVAIAQVTGAEHGSRRFMFTDPHYWATTGGHQFHIKLERNKPVPNLLQLSSTALIELRYGELVNDFRMFGPESFRSKVAAARERLGARS